MLFRDFFPRLQARAFDRYDEEITERQFRDWVEDGLLPGPAAPVGRGRGRAPDRHWPIASYRRALRICRYKSRGARRCSQWRIGFWLSGETVAANELRHALSREHSILRRQNRSLSESGRWLNDTFHHLKDIERGSGMSPQQAVGLSRLLNISPDDFRRLTVLQFEEPNDQEDVDFMEQVASKIHGIDETVKLSPADVRKFVRVGHMSEGVRRPGDFIDELNDADFDLALELLEKERVGSMLHYALKVAATDCGPEDLLVAVMGMVAANRRIDVASRLDPIFRNLFALAADKRDGIDRNLRLGAIIDRHRETIEVIQESIAQFGRPNLIERLNRPLRTSE